MYKRQTIVCAFEVLFTFLTALNSVAFLNALFIFFGNKLVAVHAVSEPDASSPASFVVPGPQAVQTWDKTCSLAEHKVAVHAVSEPHALSPASFVVPGPQGAQTLEETYSSVEHTMGALNTYTEPTFVIVLSLSSSRQCATINAVLPYKETEIPKRSHSAALLA